MVKVPLLPERASVSGKPAVSRRAASEGVARKLRKLDPLPLAEVAAEGAEFTLLVARRLPDGEVVLLGEVSEDIPLLERTLDVDGARERGPSDATGLPPPRVQRRQRRMRADTKLEAPRTP